jgi:hypothetical protein
VSRYMSLRDRSSSSASLMTGSVSSSSLSAGVCVVGAAALAVGREGAEVAAGTVSAERAADPLECPLVRCGEAEGERGTMLLGTLVDA